MNTILVTGGSGFIGSNFILKARRERWAKIINFDKLTYAGNPWNLVSLNSDNDYLFVKGDINNQKLVQEILNQYQPDSILHLAAESHVDRSIFSPGKFVETNVLGTISLLEASLDYWQNLSVDKRQSFKFLHVSTDEVYGSLEPDDYPFLETTPYKPNSPYAASKAASDHFVRAYYNTYELPTLCINCSNNYGPRQFPEKLIPLMILNAQEKKELPIYGDGQNIRDWLYVTDHCYAIWQILIRGRIGETYNIGGENELTNLEVVEEICRILDSVRPQANFSHSDLVTFVKDRPGHDRRYAVNCDKIKQTLGWQPEENFKSGIKKTVDWYLKNSEWIAKVRSREYQEWITQNYHNR